MESGNSRGAATGPKALCNLPFTAETGAKHPLTRQLQTAHVGAGGWELHGSSPTVCAGKVETPWERGWVVSSVTSRFYSRLTSTSMYFCDILKRSFINNITLRSRS